MSSESRKGLVISWFSAGVSSAVATKLAIEKIHKIIYIHIDDQHPDSMRFIKDCEKWFGRRIQIIQSPYKSVNNALLGAAGYINGPKGAACSRLLKRRVREEWEAEQSDSITYIWGMDVTEKHRQNRIKNSLSKQNHLFPLIKQSISKSKAHQILKASGITRPAMYKLGYHNNNCIGCVKGGMGYWNKIRIDFPEVFESRAKIERRVGASCINGVYLDELTPRRGRQPKPICEKCGLFCEGIERYEK